jgi:hypothetical protein
MPYSNFTIKKVQNDFQIKIIENSGIFSNIPSHEISNLLQETLTENVPLATVITSGNLWKFLRLEDNTLYIDLDDYVIKDITKIVGILYSMIEQT